MDWILKAMEIGTGFLIITKLGGLTAAIYSLTVLEVRSLASRCRQVSSFQELSGRDRPIPLS